MKPSSDVFRPRLPIDPFLDLDLDRPWLISSGADPHPPNVVLVLGAPSQAELQPLLASQFLTDSLVLLATHAPPPLPAQPQPTVLILRLDAAPDEMGAVQLASIFERAGHIVQQWRTRKTFFGDGKIAQLAEKYPGGNFTQLEYYTAGLVDEEAPTSPRPLSSAIRSYSSFSNSRSLLKRKSIISPSASTHSLPSPTKTQAKDYAHSNRRMFDAILNFLPSSLPEKDILKHAILVTTLSVPFLTCTLSHQAKTRSTTTDLSKRRFSSILLSRPSQNNIHGSDVRQVPTVRPARLVHVLPPSSTASPIISLSTSISSSSSGTNSRPVSSFGSPSLRSPFLTRHPSPTSASRSSSSSTLLIPSSYSPTSTHIPTPISAPIHSRFGSQTSSLSSCKKPKLAQTIEQFLLSFAYPSRPTLPTPSNDLPQSKTVPYLLAPGVLNSPVCIQGGDSCDGERSEVETLVSEGRLTVVEATLLGLLDVCAKGEDVGKSLKSAAGLVSRAWIGDRQRVMLVPKCGVEANDDIPSPSPVRLTSVAVPAPALSPGGREKERRSPVIREVGLYECPTTPNRVPPSRSTSPQPDKSSVKKPTAVVVPRTPVSLTLTIGTADAKGESLDRTWIPGLVPLDNSSSAENSGGTEYESCETSYSMDNSTQTRARSEVVPAIYDPYHTSFLDPNWSRVEAEGDEMVITAIDSMAKKGIKGRLGHGFKSLTKAVSISALAASSMAAKPSVLRRGMRRERDMLRPVVV